MSICIFDTNNTKHSWREQQVAGGPTVLELLCHIIQHYTILGCYHSPALQTRPCVRRANLITGKTEWQPSGDKATQKAKLPQSWKHTAPDNERTILHYTTLGYTHYYTIACPTYTNNI